MNRKKDLINRLEIIITQQKGHGNGLTLILNEAHERLQEQLKTIEEQNKRIEILTKAAARHERVVHDIQITLMNTQSVVQNLRNSLSWRVTLPLRMLYRIVFLSANKGRQVLQDIPFAVRLMKRQGIRSFVKRLIWYMQGKRLLCDIRPNTPDYQDYVEEHRITNDEQTAIEQRSALFGFQPKISVILYSQDNPYIPFLEDSVRSVTEQYYRHWELCLYISCATGPDVTRFVQNLEKRNDSRMKIVYGKNGLNVQEIMQECVSQATGEFIGLLGAGDMLAANALFEIVNLLNMNGNIDIVYTDEDRIDGTGQRSEPFFKPDWSPEYLSSYNYISYFAVAKECIVKEIIRERLTTPILQNAGAVYYNYILRLTDFAKNIIHIPKVLYHKRVSVYLNMSDSNVVALKGYLNAPSISERYSSHSFFTQGSNDRFSLVILTRDSPQYIIPLLESLKRKDMQGLYEVVVGDTGSTNREVLDYYDQNSAYFTTVTNIPYRFGRNYNQLITQNTNGNYIGIINDDILLPGIAFLDQIKQYFQNSKISIVGSKLLYPNRNLQHFGVSFVEEEGSSQCLPYHRLHNRPEAASKSFRSCAEYIPAVTGAFLFCRRDDFFRVNGFDENYIDEAQDIDLCLKIRRLGQEVLFVNIHDIIHVENGTREKGSENAADRMYFLSKWSTFIRNVVLFHNLNKGIAYEDT